jgi:hypothetical protein
MSFDKKEYHKEKTKQWRLDNKEKDKQYRLDNKDRYKQWRLDNKEKIKQYELDNKEKIKKRRKQYELDNKDRHKQYYLNNKEKINQYRLDNKEKINSSRKERIKKDPLFKLSTTLRTRIYTAVKVKCWNKRNKTAEILGCDYETVKKHLENQFIDGMCWKNHGRWHIDHIKPLAKAETEEELYKRCHYTNLQPLWAADNLSKGAKEL